MQKFVVLFRGINVGGNNLLPMKSLVPLLKENNFEQVAAYIQSGNVVLNNYEDPTEKIKHLVLKNYGFSPEIFTLPASAFFSASDNNPYHDVEGKFMHLYFCKNNIQRVEAKLTKFLAESEQFTVKNNVFYLYAPKGIGRSKLVANIESCLGQTATGRNLNTINKIASMLK